MLAVKYSVLLWVLPKLLRRIASPCGTSPASRSPLYFAGAPAGIGQSLYFLGNPSASFAGLSKEKHRNLNVGTNEMESYHQNYDGRMLGSPFALLYNQKTLL
jgi:hypothetical protein